MTAAAKDIRGISKFDDGSAVDVSAVIFASEPEDGQPDWSCRVHCPFLFAEDKRIVGADADQALALAEALIRNLFEYRGVEIEDAASSQ